MSKSKRQKTQIKPIESEREHLVTQNNEAEQPQQIEELPSVEWGDRIHSGKVIARSGKDTGHVPGASPSK